MFMLFSVLTCALKKQYSVLRIVIQNSRDNVRAVLAFAARAPEVATRRNSSVADRWNGSEI